MEADQLKSILQKIFSHAVLLDHHRKELREKRGFTDQVIDLLQLRSCGPYLAGKVELKGVPDKVRASLKDDRILIPYLNNSDEVYFLRPHKMGLPDIGVQIYIPLPLMKEAFADKEKPFRQLVLAESEFKAAASCLMGVPAIGIPGVASFSKKNFGQMTHTLKNLECEEVTICFDNEVKDNKDFPNYKKDFKARYDTQIWAYIMAKQLEAAKIKVTIATLKNEWRVHGKADIDGVLAQKVKPEDYQQVIAAGVKSYDFKAHWQIPKAHESFVQRRIDRFFYRGPIEEEFKCYYKRNAEGKEQLTNFTIKIVYTMFSDSKTERFCRLESAYGNSRMVTVDPETMVSKAAFQRFCYGLGDYEFMGSDKDLTTLWSYIMLHQDGVQVTKLQSYGYDDQHKIWFFQNGAYVDGLYYPIDDDGLIWVEEKGFMIPDSESEDIFSPNLSPAPEARLTVKIVYDHLSRVIEPNFAKLILGWALGNFFMPEILREYKVYPFLFLHGKLQAGKSTIANWISSFFGFTQKGFPYVASSLVGITRMVSKFSMVPVWLEEYRNKEANVANKNNLLRSIYDQSTIVKGTKRPNEIQTYRARSTLILSGEEMPTDAALNSRCIIMPVYGEKKQSAPCDFRWLQENAINFKTIGHDVLINKNKYWAMIKERIGGYSDAFNKDYQDADRRSKLHMSIIAGITDSFLTVEQDFVDFVAVQTVERTRMVDRNQALNIFFDDIYNLYNTGKIEFQFMKRIDGNKSEVAFYFSGVFMLWEQFFFNKRNEMPCSKLALMEHIKSESYYIEPRNIRFNNRVLGCMILHLKDGTFPAILENMLNNIEERYVEKEPEFDPKPLQFGS